jgi:sec-independent protein translocase protein TatB
MFNVGGGELLVISVLALIVLGPNRLPTAARQVGKIIGDLRRLSTGFQDEVRTAFDLADQERTVAPRRDVLAADSVDDAPSSTSAAVASVSDLPVAPVAATADDGDEGEDGLDVRRSGS